MLNTLSIARKLSESGVTQEQAEAIANVVADAVNQQNGILATKDFVHDQVNVVRGEISSIRGEISDLRVEVSDLRGDMNTKISSIRGEISDLRGDMNANDSALDAKISASETRIVRWIVGTGLTIVGLLVTSVGILLSILL